MNCPNCNSDYKIGDIFCENCGFNLKINHSSDSQKDIFPLSQDLLIRYQQLEEQITELNEIENEISQAFQYHEALTQEAKKIEDIYKKRQFEAKKEFKDVEELKNLTWKSLKSRISGKKDQLLKTEETEYFEAINKEEEAKTDFNEIMKRVNTAYSQLTNVRTLGKKKLSLQKELGELLDQIYKGGKGDHTENNLENELKNLEGNKKPILSEQSRLTTALGHLKSANNHFNQGLRKLDSAKGFANWDTFMGGGFFVDSMKHSRVRDARNAVQQGHYSVERAYKIVTNLPTIRKPHIEEGNYLWDTWFDNIWSDMQARERINRSRESVRYTVSEVHSVINWAQTKINSLNNQLNNLDRNIVLKRNELINRRRELIEQELKYKK
ncbi:MAG: hypothetical protein HeimC3_22210 [Candidatus Heimdallarchaeota archaeon LC_3]|nr:MAG: hypothetical protein HeimC3_22210 [Candidatus Heimdallarchaeota archaeon LC_3]